MDLFQTINEYDYTQLQSPEIMNLTEEQLEELMGELQSYHNIFSPHFTHISQSEYSYNYILGLLNPCINRKSAENIAIETVDISGVRKMQNFLGQSHWTGTPLLEEHRTQISDLLGDDNGVLILDGSDFPKQGEESVGVKRQHCGELGKIANCQAGVFLGYSSCHGYTLMDHRLYIPKEWFTPQFSEKRFKTGIPIDLTFSTKNELAWDMLESIHASGAFPARWVTMDEAFGRDTLLLDRIANETNYFYFAEVPKDTRLWLSLPRTYLPEYSGIGRPPTRLRTTIPPRTVESILHSIREDEWQPHSLKEGEKGFIAAEIVIRRVLSVRDSLPGPTVWLIIRRNLFDHSQVHYYLSNAPLHIDSDLLIAVSACRWPIETIIQQAKQHLGMNEYETRSWLGWHHHMTLVTLAFGFLARSIFSLRENSPAITLPQTVQLLAAVLPRLEFNPRRAINLLKYRQKRNSCAKKSHYLMQKNRIMNYLFDTQ